MHYTPGLEGCTGSLGQGLSYANGMALAARVKGLSYRVYCLIGDGELQEGQVWEAATTAPRFCLSNVTAIVDRNGLKAMDARSAGSRCGHWAERWRPLVGPSARSTATTWHGDLRGPRLGHELTDRPGLIVAHTVKGKGVSFMENQVAFHNAALTDEQHASAVAELEAGVQACAAKCSEVAP